MNNILGRAKTFISKRRPEILLMLGTAGLIATTVLAVTATPTAIKRIKKEKEAKERDLKPIETVKTVWKCYIPAAATCLLSVTAIICSGTQNAKRNAALATAYSLSETAFTEYRNKVIKTIGEKKEREVKDEIAKDKLQHCTTVQDIIITGTGETRCYDSLSGRPFKSDRDYIIKAINKLNRDMRDELFISLNDFYYELRLPPNGLGDLVGWDIDNGYIDIDFSSQLDAAGNPCLVIDYRVAPKYNPYR